MRRTYNGKIYCNRVETVNTGGHGAQFMLALLIVLLLAAGMYLLLV